MCFFATVHAQDANKKSKSNVTVSEKTNTVAKPAPAIEAANMMVIDASALGNDRRAQPAAPSAGTITIDAGQLPNDRTLNNKVQQAPAKK